ncbi:MAG: hypothetical protein RIC55_01360 [Pirellulaceae bacterium]
MSVFLLAVLALATPASAVVVFRKGVDDPIMGFLMNQDADRVLVSVPQPEGRSRQIVIPRSDIVSLIETVDRERLAGLSHETPKQYRDYGEELSEKRQDPEARQTAIRLFLISVWLDPSLARSAMLGMIRLARDEQEEARFRALAYLLDEEHDRSVLKPPQITVEASSDLDAQGRANIRRLLQLLRQGRADYARQLLTEKPEIIGHLKQFDDVVNTETIQSAALGKPIVPSVLSKLVELEVALSTTPAPAADPAEQELITSWSEGRRMNGYRPLPVIKLETVTEFNPRQCLYRDGAWIDPDRE